MICRVLGRTVVNCFSCCNSLVQSGESGPRACLALRRRCRLDPYLHALLTLTTHLLTPTKPPRPLLRWLRVAQIHELLSHPKSPGRHDHARPLPPSPINSISHTRCRLWIRLVGLHPLWRSTVRRRPTCVVRNGHCPLHAGNSSRPRC